MSRLASTAPKTRSKSTRMVSRSLAAARVAARLTATEVTPTPPAAPVTEMICGPRAVALGVSARPRSRRLMISRTSAVSAGSVRNSRAPARMARRINALSLLRLAGRMVAGGSACVREPISSTARLGSWSRTTIVTSGAIPAMRLDASS